jgi:hypothetical protein
MLLYRCSLPHARVLSALFFFGFFGPFPYNVESNRAFHADNCHRSLCDAVFSAI